MVLEKVDDISVDSDGITRRCNVPETIKTVSFGRSPSKM